MRATAKLTFLVAVMAMTASVNAWAQTHDRSVDAETPAEKSVTPQLPPVFAVNNNIVGYYYLPATTNPGAGQTPQNGLFFSHFDVWNYGTNFVNVQWLKATNGDAPPFGTPAKPCDQNGPLDPPGSSRCPGYTEIYGFFRSTFGWNQIFKTKAFSAGPLTNVEFIVGADLNTDNTTFRSARRAILGGLQFDFEMPYKGYFNVAVMGYKEWEHDGFASTFPSQPIPNPSGRLDFDPTWAVEVDYSQPLGSPSSPFFLNGFVVMHGPKGCGEPCQPLGPGHLRTTEYLTQNVLNFDVGQVMWNAPKRVVIFGGYRWWKNKYGISPDQPNGFFVGTTESTWLAGTTMKF